MFSVLGMLPLLLMLLRARSINTAFKIHKAETPLLIIVLTKEYGKSGKRENI